MDFTRSVENAVKSMEDFAGDSVQHYMLEELAAQSRAWTNAVLRASEARCKNKWKKKPARGVSEQARDINKIDTRQSTHRP